MEMQTTTETAANGHSVAPLPGTQHSGHEPGQEG
jgi:hypothetical protein